MEELEFIIDLKESKSISSLGIGYLHSPSNWIYIPQLVEVSFSNDGHSFSNDKKVSGSSKFSQIDSSTGLLVIDVNPIARFIKINIKGIDEIPEFNPGSGNPGWFFIDEIIIK